MVRKKNYGRKSFKRIRLLNNLKDPQKHSYREKSILVREAVS